MRDRYKIILVIFLISLTFLGLGINSETGLIGRALSIFTGSNVMVRPQIIVIYTLYSGATTEFSAMTFNELQAVDNMTMEIPVYGRMDFPYTVNITACMDVERVVNFNQHMGITTNSVTINTSGLPCVNGSATISLYQVSFDQPRVLRNGEPCPTDVCTIVSYTRGMLFVFNVTDFSNYTVTIYSVEEGAAPGPTGPAGPVTPGPPVYNFTVDRDFFKVLLKQGESLLESMTIKNTGNMRLRFSIDPNNLKNYVVLSEDMFYLNPGQSKTISIAFNAGHDQRPDVYPGRFIITTDSPAMEVVLAVMEVREKKPLFDIFVSTKVIPQEVYLGEEIEADIMIYNFGDLSPVDVSLYYSLRDFTGNDMLFAQETFAVQEQKIVTKRIRIPEDFEPGYYLFYARLTYDSDSVSSSAIIRAMEREAPLLYIEPWYILSLILILVIIAIILAYVYHRKKSGQPVLERPRRMPQLRFHKKHELSDIEREVGRDIIKIKARRPRKTKDIDISPLLKKKKRENV